MNEDTEKQPASSAAAPKPQGNIWWQLISCFMRAGALTFGGGYAMLPILRREVVENHPWCTDEELADYYAIGQCTPGIIAINTSTFVGYKLRGIPGAILATLSFAFPSFVIILIIASVLQNFAEYAVVKNAFAGIRVAVTVLILNAVIKLFKSAVKDKLTLAIFILVFLLAAIFSVSPVLYVLASGALGIAFFVWKEARKK